jgi:signal transduction histidine kinase
LSSKTSPLVPRSRPETIALVAIYSIYTAVVLRTFARTEIRRQLPVYLALEFLYLVLFTGVLWRPIRWRAGQHLYFIFQSLLVFGIYLLFPKFDFVLVLFNPLSFQAALVFPGRARWCWAAVCALLTGLPLTVDLGMFGLAVALLPITVNFIFPAYITVNQEIDAGLRTSEALLNELQIANQQLTIYASQVEELSAIQERNRLARELHDSISQTIFGIILHSRATRLLLERDSEHLDPQLEQLKSLTQSCLEQMRGVIASLRPVENDSAQRPTP